MAGQIPGISRPNRTADLAGPVRAKLIRVGLESPLRFVGRVARPEFTPGRKVQELASE
jgi:hypothetical protein